MLARIKLNDLIRQSGVPGIFEVRAAFPDQYAKGVTTYHCINIDNAGHFLATSIPTRVSALEAALFGY